MATETVETYTNGVLVSTVTVTVPTELANARDLQTKARSALAANAAYLALASPTAVQNTAQIKLLTRETNALIRLLLYDLADVSDT